MKVKVINRNPDDYLRETKRNIHKVPRNFDPSLHPFEAAREYVRALNAVKLERVFAKPFVASLDGHRDGISCMGKHPQMLSFLISGAYDGEIRMWDVPQQMCLKDFVAHNGVVRGITFTNTGNNFITIGDDKLIKTWKTDNSWDEKDDIPIKTIPNKTVLTSITHHYKQSIFATCGEICQLWEDTRNESIKKFKWGVSSLHDVKFNPIETHVLSACCSDSSIILYDIRDVGPVHKVVMKMKTNSVAWNPLEAFVFTAANEDYNLYSFDTRNLRRPINVHMDHVSAVIDLDYSPTGKEFVSGSYDKTIRIFETSKGHSRDVYHTKRMQRLTCIKWSLDNKYILSSSDEMNIRIWKTKASEKLGVLKPRERVALNYSEVLKEKYASHPQIKRIARHRQVPKHVYNAQRELRMMKDKIKRKDANRRAHSKKGQVPFEAERKKSVISVQT
ncbi:DDB1- and CUL4-associated factor 13 [Agrilus planipennis]|uniref:DDB1- and CUL4-associated factor 13 n=1 Tax=Agrilus planipennis TaxID=224129 RepID=A0A1W4W599_AGRPL|nr:DDB1- and CUL4-associated factor 13 [Agrilus planipennis]